MMRLPYKSVCRLTTPYGKKGSWACGWHIGIDLVGINKTIYPIADGIVTRVGNDGSYGNHVRIQHDNGYISLYAHLSRIDVKSLQKITTALPIGIEGSTGNTSGSHLHLEIHKGAYKYPPKNSSPASCPWLVNPAEALGIENKIGIVKAPPADDAAADQQSVSSWAQKAQAWAKEKGISDGLRPQDNVTREEIWSMLIRLLGNK
ncbi:MAG: M23 family metallopeptidase [Bacillota bacterium]|jgi:hypothetical protein